MSIYFWLIHKFQDRKYPKDIRIALNKKYKSLHRHEKKIKNILKYSGCFNLFNFKYNLISHKNIIRIKHHRYMINKINKDINIIKNYFNE